MLEKYGYRIEMTAKPSAQSPASGSADTFLVTARPMPGTTGRSFQIDAEGRLTEIK